MSENNDFTETGGLAERVAALADEWESGHLVSAMRWPTITLADAVQQLRALLVPDQQTSEGSER